MISKLLRIKLALAAIPDLKVYHYFRPQLEFPFCIWSEDGESGSISTGNHKSGQIVEGTVDYFSQKEFDPMVDNIQEALNNIEGVSWRLNSVQYEDNTNAIHHEWMWRII